MKHTVENFLDHEIEEIHKNIDRIKNHLDDGPKTIAYSGQRAILALQRQHLSIIEDLQEQVHSFDELMSVCRQNILENERLHSKISAQENHTHTQPRAEWWSTLHLIQFWTDLLNRAQNYMESNQINQVI